MKLIKSRALSPIVLVALTALVITSSLTAYVLLSPARTWDSAPTYIIDDRGAPSITDVDGGLTATVDAINSNAAWNGAGSGTVVNAVAGNTSSWSLGDGTPMLRFDDPENVCTGNCLAATFTGFYSNRGDGTYRIDDADIVTNTGYNWTSLSEPDGCSNEFYIEGVQVHEIGHGLGLGHSNVSGATMFPSVSSCDNGPASTAQDDDDAINFLYSGTGPGPSCSASGTFGCSTGSDCCSGTCARFFFWRYCA